MGKSEFTRPYFDSKIFEFWGGNFQQLNDPAYFKEGCLGLFEELGISVISGPHISEFDPQGLSAVATFKESHCGLHTWPEYGYARGVFEICSPHVNLNRLPTIISHYFDYSEIMLYGVGAVQLPERPTLPRVLTANLRPTDITHFTKRALEKQFV